MLGALLAFCGFYVAGSNQQLYNDATQVVLMRSGTRTVLAMQNNYKGPPEAFAMVVPVPVVLHEGDVKTLAKDVFAHVEAMGAPRLVEYWEQDPCNVPKPEEQAQKGVTIIDRVTEVPDPTTGVKVEARFNVGEYQIVILSAKEATGLEIWLHDNKYNIPAGAEPLLRPYVEAGSKFFVARVDVQKVQFVDGRAALSPLRFHYDADEFSLPIRLGLAASSGTQDLIVNILAPNQRYELANYPNVTIPTNIDVTPAVKDKFGAFYAALFDRTLEKHPGAIVTEYAWSATSCDPCTGPVLDDSDFLTLGADVLAGSAGQPLRYNGGDFVLTRLHARYGKDIKNDLVFKAAQAIVGGREMTASDGTLETGAHPDRYNNFQGRYAIRHPWLGPIKCEHPIHHVWGGPPDGPQPTSKPALDLAFAPRNAIQLASAVTHDVPEIDLAAGASETRVPGSAQGSAMAASQAKKASGCGCQASGRNDLLPGALVVGAGLLFRRRRRP
jgi:hypothetical protein